MAKINVGGGDRERDEGEEGPRRGRPARDPGGASRKASCPAAAWPCCGPSSGLKAAKDLTHDEEIGYNIIVRACRSPIQQIAENAGEDGDVVANEGAGEQGRELRLRRPHRTSTCDMVKAGIIDPTKVARSALQNAASVATLLLTTDALIAEEQKKDDKKGGGEAAATTICIESRRFLVVSCQKAGARGPSSAGSCFYRPPLIFARGGSAVGSGKGVTPGIGPGGGTMAGRLDASAVVDRT